MKYSELILKLEELQEHLIVHRNSLQSYDPFYDNDYEHMRDLELQARTIRRITGCLAPYQNAYGAVWGLVHRATGAKSDMRDAALNPGEEQSKRIHYLNHYISRIDTMIGGISSVDPAKQFTFNNSDETASSSLSYLSHLHPFIYNGCGKLYLDGHYAKAVGESAKAVFQYIRNVTGLTLDGPKLVQYAFGTTNKILMFSDLTDETKLNEQIGFMEMVAGYGKGVRHPLAHTHGKEESAQRAFEYMAMASLFCRRIDDAVSMKVNTSSQLEEKIHVG